MLTFCSSLIDHSENCCICQASSRGQESEMLGPIALQQNMEQACCTNHRWGNHPRWSVVDISWYQLYPWNQLNLERQDKKWVQEWFRRQAVSSNEWQWVSTVEIGMCQDVSRCLKCQAWIIQSNERVRLGPVMSFHSITGQKSRSLLIQVHETWLM